MADMKFAQHLRNLQGAFKASGTQDGGFMLTLLHALEVEQERRDRWEDGHNRWKNEIWPEYQQLMKMRAEWAEWAEHHLKGVKNG